MKDDELSSWMMDDLFTEKYSLNAECSLRNVQCSKSSVDLVYRRRHATMAEVGKSNFSGERKE